MFPPPVCWDLTLAHFDPVSEHVPAEVVQKSVQVSHDPFEHAELIQGFIDLGFDAVYLHYVGQDQERYLDTFGDKVLPQFR
ncbi:hypothetical protein [Mariniluteicoccus flavus]